MTAPACGDVMKLQLKLNPDTDVIEDVKFKTYGCGSDRKFNHVRRNVKRTYSRTKTYQR